MSPGENNGGARRRIVVVGLGSIGRRHLRLLRRRPDLCVEACEPSAAAREQAAPETTGLTVHHDFAGALATVPDAFVLATPHGLHAAHAIEALRAGVHVLCEKPLCVGVADAARMVAAANEAQRILAVGFQLHFLPCFRRARDIIESGALGSLLHVHARVGSLITLRNSGSRYQATIEGSLLLDYAHQPDLLFWLTGELPSGVTLAGLEAGALPFSSNPNVLSLTLDYARPLLATIHLNYVQMPQRHEWEIVGDKGWLLVDPDRGQLRLGLRETERETIETFAAAPDEPYILEHQAFFDSIEGLRPPESPASLAARSVELFSAAMRSWKLGRRVACRWTDFSKPVGARRSPAPAVPIAGKADQACTGGDTRVSAPAAPGALHA